MEIGGRSSRAEASFNDAAGSWAHAPSLRGSGIHEAAERLEAIMADAGATIGPHIARAASSVRASTEPTATATAQIYGAASAGQFTVAFVDWIRRTVEAEDIRHLAFLARDGLLPLQVAQSLPGDYFAGRTLNYLQANRRSWGLAAASVVGVEAWREIGLSDEFAFLLYQGPATSLEAMLQRCGLLPADLPSAHPLAKHRPDQPLGSDRYRQWRDLLMSGELDDKISRAAGDALEVLARFVRQRSLPGERIALIDIGWRGQQAWLISEVITEFTGHRPLNLHFGGDGASALIDSKLDIQRFALDDAVEKHPISAPVICLETFLAPGTPRVVGYAERDDGSVVEVLDHAGAAVSSVAKQALMAGAIRVAANMPPKSETEGLGDCRAPVRQLLAEIWENPQPVEVDVVRRMYFELDDSGRMIVPIAARYRMREFIRRPEGRRLWPAGSLAITPEPMKSIMSRILGR